MPFIRVNSLSPKYIRAAATAESLRKPGMESGWAGDNMLYRLSTADGFRAPMPFLLGDESGFMTVSDLRVDGGTLRLAINRALVLQRKKFTFHLQRRQCLRFMKMSVTDIRDFVRP